MWLSSIYIYNNWVSQVIFFFTWFQLSEDFWDFQPWFFRIFWKVFIWTFVSHMLLFSCLVRFTFILILFYCWQIANKTTTFVFSSRLQVVSGRVLYWKDEYFFSAYLHYFTNLPLWFCLFICLFVCLRMDCETTRRAASVIGMKGLMIL